MQMSGFQIFGAALAVALVVAACTQPKPKPVVPPPEEAAVPKLGVVGLITEVKERGMTGDNWTGVIGDLFKKDGGDRSVISTRYEVTVFYDDSTTGVVVVDQKPTYVAGQRVRVTGSRIEVLRR